jgi:hypothetical protein
VVDRARFAIHLLVIDLMSLPYGYFISEIGTHSHDKILEEKRREVKNGWTEFKDRSWLLPLQLILLEQNLDQKFSKIHSPM